jgi:hypothetical protein
VCGVVQSKEESDRGRERKREEENDKWEEKKKKKYSSVALHQCKQFF